jgi:hypothetical protein
MDLPTMNLILPGIVVVGYICFLVYCVLNSED